MSQNNSTTGGYLKPAPQAPLPPNLDIVQFIQQVLVGISSLPGTLVRPKWQTEPLKNPDVGVNWLAFGVQSNSPDANAFTQSNSDGSYEMQRHEKLEISCSFYGPQAAENAAVVRDGFQIQQNLANLTAAKMGYTEVGPAQHIPDLVNERWINRVEMTVYLTRMIQRVYPILTFVSVSGVITTENQGDDNQTFTFDSGT